MIKFSASFFLFSLSALLASCVAENRTDPFVGFYSHKTHYGEPWLDEGVPAKQGKACLSVIPQSGGAYRVEVYRVENSPSICNVVGTGRLQQGKMIVTVDSDGVKTSFTLLRDNRGMTVRDATVRPAYCGVRASINGLQFSGEEKRQVAASGQCAEK